MITKFGTVLAAVSLLGTTQANADQYQRWVEVFNGGNETIWSVYITNIREPNPLRWGDVLGEYVINPGYSMVVEPYVDHGYCRFDIIVEYESGREVPVWDVNLCVEDTIFVNEMGYTQVGY